MWDKISSYMYHEEFHVKNLIGAIWPRELWMI